MTDTYQYGDAIRNALAEARRTNPELEAEARRVAQRTGASLPALRDTPREDWPADDFDIDGFVRDYGRTARFLADPDNARIAGPNGPRELSMVERSLYTAGDLARRAAGGAGEALGLSIAGLGRAGARTFDDTVAEAFFENAVEVGQTVARGGRNVGGNLRAGERETLRDPLPAPRVETGFGGDVASALGQIIAQVAVAVGTGGAGSTAALAGQGVGSMDERVQAAREREGRVGAEDYTLQEDLALIGGGAVTALSERIGLDAILGRLPPAVRDRITGRIANIVAAGGTEGLTEVAETVGQNALARYLLSEDTTLLDGAVEATSVSAVAGSIAAAVFQSALPGRQRAEADANAVQAFNDAAAAQPLRERSPEVFERYLAEVAADGPIQNLYVNAEVFAQTLEQAGMDPAAVAAQVPAIAEVFETARRDGADLTIPVEQFGARLAGDVGSLLVDHLRVNPELPSRAEVASLGQEQVETLRREAETAALQAVDQEAFRASSERVRQSFEQQLTTAGRFSRDVNRAYASLVADFYTVQAARLGITPEEMADRYRLRVASEAPASATQQTTLEQEADADTITLTHYSFEQGLTRTDPSRWGAQRWTSRGEAARMVNGAPGRTYFGVDVGKPGGYKPEAFFDGARTYTATVKRTELYDMDADPENLRAKGREMVERGEWQTGLETMSLYEQLIQRAGYKGYITQHETLGRVAAVFEPLELEGRNPGALTDVQQAQVEARAQEIVNAGRAERIRQHGAWPGPGYAWGGAELVPSLDEARLRAENELFPEASIGGAPKAAKPFAPARRAAREYMAAAGLQYAPPTSYVKVDPARATRIANEFDLMAHQPDDPVVRAAYRAMIEETLAQYQFVKATGLIVEFIAEGQADPYADSPRMAVDDVVQNNHLWVFPTDAGFGGQTEASTEIDVTGNPLLEWTDEYVGDRRLRANDVFRIVHDYFGHIKDGYGFRADGEENAWQSHAAMYSPLARRALTTETRGQNSWVNYGPYGETNRTAKSADTEYAPQKLGLLPAWVSEEGFVGGANSGLPVGQSDGSFYQSDVPANPPFYSALLRAAASNPTKSAPAAQWLATLRKTPGVKAEEIEWSGLEEWLNDAEGNVSREAVETFLQNGGVKIDEVVLGGGATRADVEARVEELLDEAIDRAVEQGAFLGDYYVEAIEPDEDEPGGWRVVYPGYGQVGEAYATEEEAQEAADAENLEMEQSNLDAYRNDIRGDLEHQAEDELLGGPGAAQFATYKLPGADESYREILLTLPSIDGPSTHWDEPNVIAHARITERTDAEGARVLFLEEVQSDWHQKGRDEGYQQTLSEAEKEQRREVWAQAVVARDASIGRVSEAVSTLIDQRIAELVAVRPEAEAVGGSVLESINGQIDLLEEADQALARGVDPFRILNQGSLALVRTPEVQAVIDEFSPLNLRVAEARANLDVDSDGIPNAPFQKSWPQLVMKRMIRYAVDNGFDKIAWINGNQQNGGQTGGDGSFFYERNLVNLTNDVLKKYGARVEPVDMRIGTDADRLRRRARLGLSATAPEIDHPSRDLGIQNGFVINDKLRAAATEGFPLFQQNRGQIAFNPNDITQSPATITLLRTADLSTFLHETGHFFLEVQAHIARQPDAPAEIKADMLKTLRWFGLLEAAPATLNIGLADPAGGSNLTRERVDEVLAEIGAQVRRVTEGVSDTEPTLIVELDAALADDVLDRLSQTLGQEAIAQRLDDGSGTLGGPKAGDWGPFNPEYFLLPDGRRASEARDPIEAWTALPLEAKRPYHETFARGFEAFLMEGKAPTPGLRDLFRKFRSWLLNVYRSLTALNVELTDEVRGVMGRMLASAEAIREAEDAQRLTPLFETKPESMTDDAWAEYQTSALAATDEGLDELSRRSVRDMRWLSNAKSKVLKELQRSARAQRREIRAEVTAEVRAEPVNRARQFLRRGLDANGEPIDGAGKLDLATLQSMYGDAEDAPWRRLRRGRFGEAGPDGLHPDAVAELFGYESGDALVRDLISAEDANQKIAGLTDQRMLERYGDLVDDDALEAAANAEVANAARARFVATEMAALARMTGQPRAVAEAAKTAAAQMVNRLELKRATKSAPFFAAQARAAKAAERALAKDDVAEAARQKRNQLVNLQAARYAEDARRSVERTLTLFGRIAGGNDEAMARTRDMNLVNAARAILQAYGIGSSRKDPASALEALSRYDPVLYADIKPFIDGATGAAKPFDELTFEQFQGLRDTVNQLWTLSRRIRQIEVDGQLQSLEAARETLSQHLDTLGVPEDAPGRSRAPTDVERFSRMLQGARASLRRVESWTRATDASDNGPFRRFIWNPVSAGADRYRVAQREYLQRFLDLIRPIEATLTTTRIAAPEIGYTFGGRAELLHALLHTGNQSNLSKLLLGRGWGRKNPDGSLNTAQWDAFVARMIREGSITKADYDFAQSIWDLLDELKPGAQAAHRAMYGRFFDEIAADEIETPFGTYRGGYVPALTDAFLVQDAVLRAEQEAIEGGDSAMFPAASNGFTKSRVEDYTRELALDLRLLPMHIDKVLKFTHLGPPVRDVARLLKGRAFSAKLQAFDPVAQTDLLLPWLQRAAKQIIETPTKGQGGKLADQFFRALRSRTGMQLMFANLSNTLQQVTGVSSALVRVKPSYMGAALWRYVRDPKGTAEAVAGLSPFMSTRTSTLAYETRQTIEQMLLNPSKYEKLRDFASRHAYFMQTAAQNIVDTVAWSAAYDQALAAGETERDAIRIADSVVRETQGSLAPEDVSRFETGTPFMRLFTQFYSYFNTQANLLGSEVQTVARTMGLKRGLGRLFYVYVFGFAIPALLADAIATAMRGGLEDDEEDGYLDELFGWFFMGQVRFGVAALPVVGQAANAVIGGFTSAPYDDRVSTSPAISVVEAGARVPYEVYKSAFEGDEFSRRDVRDTLNLLGIITGLPLGALGRPVGYATGVAQGDVEPTSAADAARGLITGTPSPESRQ